MQEEKKKKELEQQKKKLQSLSVTKQKVNLEDLFVKQLPAVSKAPQTSSSVPQTTASSVGNGVTSQQGSATDPTPSTGDAPGPKATATDAPPPNTGTYEYNSTSGFPPLLKNMDNLISMTLHPQYLSTF